MIDLQEGILEIFVEAARKGKQVDRLLNWAAKEFSFHKERLARQGVPSRVGDVFYTNDRFAFRECLVVRETCPTCGGSLELREGLSYKVHTNGGKYCR